MNRAGDVRDIGVETEVGKTNKEKHVIVIDLSN